MNTKSIRSLSLMSCIALFFVAGCGDPIYDSDRWEPTLAAISSSESSVSKDLSLDEERYQWPMTRAGYVVARPVPMAFVTSFEEKLVCPDPLAAELVPWNEKELPDSMNRFLHAACDPPTMEITPSLHLDPSKFLGPQAFDVSTDGKRLVVIDDQGLAMYKCEDGSLLGHRALPDEFSSSQAAVDAVRFCGTGRDMLMASADQIIRISSKDGSVVGKAKGIGEPMLQWIVTDKDESMLVLGASGRLYGGDSRLESFEPYNVGKGVTLASVSLSPEGDRIGTVVDREPRVYLVKNHQIVEQIDFPSKIGFDPTVTVTCSFNFDAWADGDGIVHRLPKQDSSEKLFVCRSFWKPQQISRIVSAETDYDSMLCIGTRVFDGHRQTILYDQFPISRSHSQPQVLDEVPTRWTHSRAGDVVALCDGSGVTLFQRPVFNPYGVVFSSYYVPLWMESRSYDEIEKLLEILKKQKRLAFNQTSEEVRTILLNRMVNRWGYLIDDDSEASRKELKDIEAWCDRGSDVALAVKGLHFYQLAWNSRGSGYSNSISQNGWKGYQKNLEQASEIFDELLKRPSPPLVAINCAIQTSLEKDGELERVDSMCKLACEQYPGETLPHGSLAFKLLPQWFGEPGDAMSLVSAVSRIYQSPQDDLLYTLLVADLVGPMYRQDASAFRSYDPLRIGRGLDEIIRRKFIVGDNIWELWINFAERTSDNVSAEKLMRHLMETTESAPKTITQGNLLYVYGRVDAMAKKIFQEARPSPSTKKK